MINGGTHVGRRRIRGATVIAIVSYVLIAGHVTLMIAAGDDPARGMSASWLAELVSMVAWPALALLVLRQQPGNRLAWLFLGIGALYAVSGFGEDYAHYAWYHHELPGAVWFKVVGYTAGEAAWPAYWLMPQLFPAGRPVRSTLFRCVFAVSVLMYLLGTLTTPFIPGRPEPSTWKVANPLGLHAAQTLNDAAQPIMQTCFIVVIVGGGLASLLVRYRRADAAGKQQMKLFLMSVALLPLLVMTVDGHRYGWLLSSVGTGLLPLAFGFAILRYGLYDIDRLVSRTLSYAVVTGVLVGMYVGLIALTTGLFSLSSSFAVAAATLTAAAAFRPLVRRVQDTVDRRFNRRRFDAVATVDGFAAQLRDKVSLDAVRDDLLTVVARTVEPRDLSIWLPAPRPPLTAVVLPEQRRPDVGVVSR